MGSLVTILARALIVAPFLLPAVMAGLDYTASSVAFADAYPQLAQAYPVLLAAKGLLGLVIILGLPLHRALSVGLAALVVALAAWKAPFWNVIGEEAILLGQVFALTLAQAGGLVLVAAMPRRT